MRKLCAVVLIAAVAALGMPAGAYAGVKTVSRQEQGTVSGTLQDPKGETIANATINVRDSAGNLVTSVTTNSQGAFTFTAPPGTYTLQLVSAGGRSLVSGGIVTVTSATTKMTVVAAHESLGALPGHGGLFGMGKGLTIATVAITAAGVTLIAVKALKDDASPSR